ncbi:hypothetical protein ACFZBU_00360 [Embleya sp. NPDC008237]|uniref:hypothetical protein n=1 Tax=Embleya sp. NPDC008237 TaxID=3363978 RepID=UPI0036E258E9
MNEHSCGTACGQPRAETAMTDFALAAHAVAKLDRAGTALVTDAPLKELLIAEGYPVGKWIGNHSRNRDLWRRLLAIKNRMPTSSLYPAGEDFLDVEYQHQGIVVRGLAAAHLMDAMAISLPVKECWDTSGVRLRREQAIEGTDDQIVSCTDEVEVRHLSAERHVDVHRVWIREDCQRGVRTGRDMWEQRAGLYPNLQFLPRVEHDLCDLRAVWVRDVRERLEELQSAVGEWNPAREPQGPRWRSKVTPEHEVRKRLCYFTDLDGHSTLFDIHARFAQNQGRIHFRMLPGTAAIRIAYIDYKILPETRVRAR